MKRLGHRDPRAVRAAVDLGTKLGVNIKLGQPGDTRWDRKSIIVERNATYIIHEITHWLVATPKQRRALDYGLSDFDGIVHHGSNIPFEHQWRIEQRASMLGILYERALGMKYMDTVRSHSWNRGSGYDGQARRVIRWLRKNGFVQGWRPTKGLA